MKIKIKIIISDEKKKIDRKKLTNKDLPLIIYSTYNKCYFMLIKDCKDNSIRLINLLKGEIWGNICSSDLEECLSDFYTDAVISSSVKISIGNEYFIVNQEQRDARVKCCEQDDIYAIANPSSEFTSWHSICKNDFTTYK